MMEKKGTGDIWERYGVAPIDNIDKTNIIGYDNGAGQCCGKLCDAAGHLSFNENGTELNMNSLYANVDGEEFVGRNAQQHGETGVLAVNFKRPLTEAANANYSGLEIPYKEVMRRFFQCAVLQLFQCNMDLKKKERTVIFVGRPASPVWKRTEREYQRLLQDGLQERLRKIKGYEAHRVDIIVYSEPTAALAYEYSEGNIRPDEIVLIIDCGSSTFDAVLAHNRAIVAEHSRQIGAGMIEEIIVDMTLSRQDAEKMEQVEKRENMREKAIKDIAGISYTSRVQEAREAKEGYYGTDGKAKNHKKFWIPMQTETGEEYDAESKLTESFMRRVICEIPVRVTDSEEVLRPFPVNKDYPGFYAAADDFMREAKAKCMEKGKLPERVILTGGASVMPFIGELVCKHFGAKVFGTDGRGIPLERSENPAFSVGDGLAFIGRVEAVKYKARCEYRKKIEERLNGGEFREKIRRIISKVYTDASWKSLVSDFEEWVQGKFGDSLAEGIQGNGLPLPAGELTENIQKELNAVSGKIAAEVLEEFGGLFKTEIKADSDCNVDEEKVRGIIESEPEMQKATFSRMTMLGFFRSMFTTSTELTAEQKKKILARTREREWDVRYDLEAQFLKKSNLVLEPFAGLMKTCMTDWLEDLIEQCTLNFTEIAGEREV